MKKNTNTTPTAATLTVTSDAITSGGLKFSDSILFAGTPPVRPVSKPTAQGYFDSEPGGMIINATTGEIDVNKSESGLQYMVYYVSGSTGQRLDSAAIMISGIDYADGIYEITDSRQAMLLPTYNGDRSATVPGQPQSPQPNKRSEFDETDLDDDGQKDIKGANDQQLNVDRDSGIIDLNSSYVNGVFGSAPVDGNTKDVTIYYRLADKSEKALARITLRLYYYKSVSAIPKWLKDEINARQKKREASAGPVPGGPPSPPARTPPPPPPAPPTPPAPGSISGPVTGSNSILTVPKRPPLIIIVSGYLAL